MATPPKKSLGRGLGNLIGGGVAKPAQPAPALPAATPVAPAPAPAAAPNPLAVTELPVASIVPNPHQPRKEFDESAVKELAESIRSEGLLQPIVVRKVKGGYELIAGERRLRAFKQLGQKFIPVRVIEASDATSAPLPAPSRAPAGRCWDRCVPTARSCTSPLRGDSRTCAGWVPNRCHSSR